MIKKANLIVAVAMLSITPLVQADDQSENLPSFNQTLTVLVMGSIPNAKLSDEQQSTHDQAMGELQQWSQRLNEQGYAASGTKSVTTEGSASRSGVSALDVNTEGSPSLLFRIPEERKVAVGHSDLIAPVVEPVVSLLDSTPEKRDAGRISGNNVNLADDYILPIDEVFETQMPHNPFEG